MVGEKRLMAWANLLLLLLFSHAGLVVLACVAGGLLAGRRAIAPAVERVPVEPFAKGFVYFFALAPAFVATLLAVLLGRPDPVGGAEPIVVLSGLAVDRRRGRHHPALSPARRRAGLARTAASCRRP